MSTNKVAGEPSSFFSDIVNVVRTPAWGMVGALSIDTSAWPRLAAIMHDG